MGSKGEIPIRPRGGPIGGGRPRGGMLPRCGKPVSDANGSSLFTAPAVANGIGKLGFPAPIPPIADIPLIFIPAVLVLVEDKVLFCVSIVRDGFDGWVGFVLEAFKSRFTKPLGAQGSTFPCSCFNGASCDGKPSTFVVVLEEAEEDDDDGAGTEEDGREVEGGDTSNDKPIKS